MKSTTLIYSIFFVNIGAIAMEKLIDPIERFNIQSKASALESITSGNLDSLDPLVGDTACEIRAAKIAGIYLKSLSYGVKSLTSEEEEFLTLSYLLTKSKDIKRDKKKCIEKSDFKKWGITIGTQKGRSLLIALQRRLSQLSVNFLQDLALKYEKPGVFKALSYVFPDHEAFQRPTCACYPSMTIIFDYLIDLGIPILIKVTSSNEDSSKEANFYYKVSNQKYVHVNRSEINENAPVIVIESFSNLIETDEEKFHDLFTNLNIQEIILSFFAKHKQFTGKQIYDEVPYEQDSVMDDLKKDHTRHKKLALEYGCCLENSDLFLGDHIYVSTIKKTINL